LKARRLEGWEARKLKAQIPKRKLKAEILKGKCNVSRRHERIKTRNIN